MSLWLKRRGWDGRTATGSSHVAFLPPAPSAPDLPFCSLSRPETPSSSRKIPSSRASGCYPRMRIGEQSAVSRYTRRQDSRWSTSAECASGAGTSPQSAWRGFVEGTAHSRKPEMRTLHAHSSFTQGESRSFLKNAWMSPTSRSGTSMAGK